MPDDRLICSSEEPPFYYMKISCIPERNLELDHIRLKSLLIQGLKELFGDLGASLLVDVVRYSPEDSRVILRVENKGLTQVWSSLSWFHTYNGTRVRFNVEKVSACLMSLSVDSRNYHHSPISS